MHFRSFLCSMMMVCPTIFAIGQNDVVKGWHLLDKTTDGYQGISINKAFNFLKDKKPSPIVVAVLDGGIDTTHAVLKPYLWHNTKELIRNGIDEDGNGFVDDLYGWNFLGNANGENVEKETAEVIRLYHKLRPSFEGKQIDTTDIAVSSSPDYNLWLKVNKQLEVKPEDQFTLKLIKASAKSLVVYDSVIKEQWGIPVFSIQDLDNFKPISPDGKKAKLTFLRFVDLLQMDHEKNNKEILEEINDYIDRQQSLISARDLIVKNYRYDITGDTEDNLDNKHYGNADVMGQSSLHGTHVSGIIAGVMTNGVACTSTESGLKILAVRMIPRGDEYDKDVALGIRYAVDNGAKVINMSFGKELSPYKAWVDDAIRYAERHDVLIVHAAGNDAENMDITENYPSARFNDASYAPNMITVGASGDSSLKCGMIADFTNFGKQTVDVLAPGVKIYSTIPGGFGFEQGTSMAAPIVSGIAGLIRSYYPGLSAIQVRQIIEESTDKSLAKCQVACPSASGHSKEVAMSTLCKTGGIVNAYQAVLLADKVWNSTFQASSKQKKKIEKAN